MTIQITSMGGRTRAEDRRGAGSETVREPENGASCCVPRTRRGWSAPVPPASTPVKRFVDHLLPRSGWPAVGYFAAVLGLLGLAQMLPAPAYLVLDAASGRRNSPAPGCSPPEVLLFSGAGSGPRFVAGSSHCNPAGPLG